MPVDYDSHKRPPTVPSRGFPVWLKDLCREAGWEGHVKMIEIGGRGLLHDELGWVSIDELKEAAERR